MAFIRLVGSKSLHLVSKPLPLTRILPPVYSKILRSVRNTIWYRTKFENEMVASDEALMFHWKRVTGSEYVGYSKHVEPG